VAGGPARADFLDYLTKGARFSGIQIGFESGTETQPETLQKVVDYLMVLCCPMGIATKRKRQGF
jgi:hypothetical protein